MVRYGRGKSQHLLKRDGPVQDGDQGGKDRQKVSVDDGEDGVEDDAADEGENVSLEAHTAAAADPSSKKAWDTASIRGRFGSPCLGG